MHTIEVFDAIRNKIASGNESGYKELIIFLKTAQCILLSPAHSEEVMKHFSEAQERGEEVNFFGDVIQPMTTVNFKGEPRLAVFLFDEQLPKDADTMVKVRLPFTAACAMVKDSKNINAIVIDFTSDKSITIESEIIDIILKAELVKKPDESASKSTQEVPPTAPPPTAPNVKKPGRGWLFAFLFAGLPLVGIIIAGVILRIIWSTQRANYVIDPEFIVTAIIFIVIAAFLLVMYLIKRKGSGSGAKVNETRVVHKTSNEISFIKQMIDHTNQQHADNVAALENGTGYLSNEELIKIFIEYFSGNMEIFKEPGSPTWNAYFNAINTATVEMLNNPVLYNKATKREHNELVGMNNNRIPGFTNQLICGLIYSVGKYAVVPSNLLCADFADVIPNCIAVYLYLIAQKMPADNRIQAISVGDGVNKQPFVEAMESLRICDPNWQFNIFQA